MTKTTTTPSREEQLRAAQRRVAQRLESLQAVENAPNRGQWDYATALRLAEKRLDEAREALHVIEAQ